MKIGREAAFTFGSLFGPTITLIVSLVLLRDLFLICLLSGIHLLVSIVMAVAFIIRAVARKNWKDWTPRELLMWPSFWIFLSPLWAACAVIAYDWEKQNQILHYGVTIVLFILIFPALWIFFRLSGTRFS